MTCKCGSTRVIQISAKCNDLAFTTIPHLNLEHDGYMPYLGILGGDYVDLNICMDCGQIRGWKPIDDRQVLENKEFAKEAERQRERDAAEAYRQEGKSGKVETFSMVDVEMNAIKSILKSALGVDWQKDPETREVLQNTLDNEEASEAKKQAIRTILNTL